MAVVASGMVNMGLLSGATIFLFKDSIFQKDSVVNIITKYIDMCNKELAIPVDERQRTLLLEYAAAIDSGREQAIERKRMNHPDMFITGSLYNKYLERIDIFMNAVQDYARVTKPITGRTLQKLSERYDALIVNLTNTRIGEE
jgi:hypothetical protein